MPGRDLKRKRQKCAYISTVLLTYWNMWKVTQNEKTMWPILRKEIHLAMDGGYTAVPKS